MSFRDFTFPEVQQQLKLTLAEQDLFSAVPPDAPDAGFIERMRGDVALALAVNTEKARSEFIIAPVLAQLRREMGGRFGLFSGVEFDVDASRGLNGFCDFILTRSPLQTVLTAPAVAVVEAKNDNLRGGLGSASRRWWRPASSTRRPAPATAFRFTASSPPAAPGSSCGSTPTG